LLREEVSLLLDHGHPSARLYPLCEVWIEADIVRRRVNRLLKTRAALTFAALADVNAVKKGRSLFQAAMKELDDDG
jgi:hypothetical protein